MIDALERPPVNARLLIGRSVSVFTLVSIILAGGPKALDVANAIPRIKTNDKIWGMLTNRKS
jgi:hypothetical protein